MSVIKVSSLYILSVDFGVSSAYKTKLYICHARFRDFKIVVRICDTVTGSQSV